MPAVGSRERLRARLRHALALLRGRAAPSENVRQFRTLRRRNSSLRWGMPKMHCERSTFWGGYKASSKWRAEKKRRFQPDSLQTAARDGTAGALQASSLSEGRSDGVAGNRRGIFASERKAGDLGLTIRHAARARSYTRESGHGLQLHQDLSGAIASEVPVRNEPYWSSNSVGCI